MARELFAIAIMGAAIAVLIWGINFVERNLPDALGEAWGDVPALPEEAKVAAGFAEAGGVAAIEGQRPSDANNQEEPRTVPLGGGL